MAAINKKVLLVDADPQGNASTGMGVAYEDRSPNLYDLIVSEESIKVGVISDLSFSERIGNTPRKVIFKDGSVFETQNNNQIDKVVSKSGNENLISRLLQVIENKWRWALTSIAFLILLGYFIISVILSVFVVPKTQDLAKYFICLLYTSPIQRDRG